MPADLRLISAMGLRTLDAVLTGESVPVSKDHRVVLDEQTPLADRVNIAYMGTTVVAGSGSGVVAATGKLTEMGRIAGMLQRQEPESTPLQRRLAELGRRLIGVVLAIVAIIFIVAVLRGGELLEVFLLSVSLAVAAVRRDCRPWSLWPSHLACNACQAPCAGLAGYPVSRRSVQSP